MNHRIEQSHIPGIIRSTIGQSHVGWLLIAILALALGLRLWGISFGLPYELTEDEGKEIIRALKLGAGEYHWEFGKGGLYYILFVEYGFLYVFWWMMGHVDSTHEFALEVIRDPSMLFLLGRVTVAIMGALNCLVVFDIGRRLYGLRTGLIAAIIGAAAFEHAAHSHIINVDIGTTLAIWVSILAYVEYERRGDRRWLIGAGVLAGVALAFKIPGGIILPALFLAIGSRSENWHQPGRMFKEGGIVLLATFVTLSLLTPEWMLINPAGFVYTFKKFNAPADTLGVEKAIPFLTTRHGLEPYGYVQSLLRDHNLILTLTALIGLAVGFLQKQRWSIIWGVVIVLFVGIMSMSNRGQPERYLLPIMPCLWLLSSRAIVTIGARHTWLIVLGLASVVAVPLIALVRENSELTKPDTRIVAKEWIEANIPSGAKILMDGYRHRFTASPPLTPGTSVVIRQIAGVSNSSGSYRGISERTLALYAEAMKSVEGPRYDLHSTIWGLAVEDPRYYAERCFEYIITSSAITERFMREITRERFPKSAKFYEQLETHPYFRKIYSVGPIPWKRPGPLITVYEVIPSCKPAERQRDHSRLQ
jgi:hypothetical protein